MIGERVGRYRVELLLGKGGMGQVYRARDEELGRVVAIKVLAPGADAELAARMRQEARAASALSHPNAATVFDVGEHAGQPYIVMELCEGESARARVGRGGPLDVKVIILRQVAMRWQPRRGRAEEKPEAQGRREPGVHAGYPGRAPQELDRRLQRARHRLSGLSARRARPAHVLSARGRSWTSGVSAEVQPGLSESPSSRRDPP